MIHGSARAKAAASMAFAICALFAALALVAPGTAQAQTTLHKDGFSNIPAQYIVFDNLDVSKATLTTSNSAFTKANVENAFGDGIKHPTIVWSISNTGATTATNPFSVRFTNAGYDASDGSRVDLVLSCVRLETKILNNRTPKATNICLMYNSAPNGVLNYEGIQLSNVTKSGEGIIYALRQTYDVRVYKTGTNTATSRPLLFYVTDLDSPDATGTSNSWSGTYAEGINLVSGYGSDTYVASNTLLVAENSNMRFHGSAYDEETEKSAVAFTLNASGGRIAWTGGNAGCGTALFRSYVKQIKATSGTGGTIAASGTNAQVASGKSLTEKVGWRTNKSYTITPLAGYKISTIKVDGNAVSVTNSAKQTYTFSNVKANHTIAVTYTPITYKIAFNGNGSTSGSTATMTGLKGNTSYNLTANGFKRTGYTFAGWNTAANGSGTSYANKAQVKNLTMTDGATVTLYAQWTPNKLTVHYYANGATYDTLANAEVANQLLRTTTYNYDGTNLAANGVPNANRGTWCLIKPGFHATKYWLVGSGSSTTKINADTGYPKIQDFASACGVSMASGNATVNLYAEFEPDPLPERIVIVRIPIDDYQRSLDSGYGTPSFIATHASQDTAVRCLLDFLDSSESGGFRIATCTVQAPANAACSLANSTRFHIANTEVDGYTTVFTLGLSGLASQASSASAINHVEIGSRKTPAASRSKSEIQQDSQPASDQDAEVDEDRTGQTDNDPIAQENEGQGEQEAAHLLATGETVNSALPQGIRHVSFESTAVPEGTPTTDLSAYGDGSVMGYYREVDKTFVITSGVEGEVIFSNADSSRLFEGEMELETVSTDNLDLSGARDLSFMFADCTHLEEIDASEWDIKKVERTTGMFQACTSLQQLSIGDYWSTGLDAYEPAAFPVAMIDGEIHYQAGDAIPAGKATYTAAPTQDLSIGEYTTEEAEEPTGEDAETSPSEEDAPIWTDDLLANADVPQATWNDSALSLDDSASGDSALDTREPEAPLDVQDNAVDPQNTIEQDTLDREEPLS